MLVAITPINLYLLNPITHYINIIIYERLNNNINNSQSLIRIYIGNKRMLAETIEINLSRSKFLYNLYKSVLIFIKNPHDKQYRWKDTLFEDKLLIW